MNQLNVACTIITPNFVPYAQSLYTSLKDNNSHEPLKFYAFIAAPRSNGQASVEGITFLYLDELLGTEIGKRLYEKYFHRDMDAFRWSMKPVLINYLIQEHGAEKVLYLDSDLFFFSDFKFLFNELDQGRVLLSPHWRSSNPRLDSPNFFLQYTSGLYNGGFVGANKDAVEVMDWWASACEYVCEKNPTQGQFVDQTHLNLLPVFFEGIVILRHRGCNVANWNQLECRRVKDSDGNVLINGEYPIVFIHFTSSTIRAIYNGVDSLLFPYLDKFTQTLKTFKPDFDLAGFKQLKTSHHKTKNKNDLYFKVKRLFRGILPASVKNLVKKNVVGNSHSSNNVHCPVCGVNQEKYGPYGTRQRENALCLRCGSLERHRLIWMYILENTNFHHQKKIRLLHFAPEKCFFNKFIKFDNVEYVACDLYPEVFTYDKNKRIQKVDITSIPFPDNHFDIILCNHVLEHIPDDRKAMSELHRVMSKGGWGIFQVPIDYKREVTYEDFSITTPEGRAKAFGQIDHVRWYGKDYKDRLKSVGFEVDENDYVRKFSADEVARFGLSIGEMIYHCKKN